MPMIVLAVRIVVERIFK